jgi:histidine ammonia-lyase
LQDRHSIRCAPQVLGVVLGWVAALREDWGMDGDITTVVEMIRGGELTADGP